MELHVEFTPRPTVAEKGPRDRTVVVIDTLRATSTIATALHSGAREVAPVATAEEAVQVAMRLGTERTLLCGERGGLKIEGFHLGNSPFEYTPEVVRGKTLVMKTTNGTAALLAARGAGHVICGSLINARAVAGMLVQLRAERVTMKCAGTGGRFSMEDSITAGAIIAELGVMEPGLNLHADSAVASFLLYSHYRKDLAGALAATVHGKILTTLGLGADIPFCASINSLETVPIFQGSTIKGTGP